MTAPWVKPLTAVMLLWPEKPPTAPICEAVMVADPPALTEDELLESL